MLANWDIIFPIYGQFAAIRKPDSGRMVYKTYIFINNNVISYKTWKSKRTKKSLTQLSYLLLWVKVLSLPKKCIRNAEISKIK